MLGTVSKIVEETEELQDAVEQQVKILVGCELADLYGAMKALGQTWGFEMDDIRKMSELTENAFKQGHR